MIPFGISITPMAFAATKIGTKHNQKSFIDHFNPRDESQKNDLSLEYMWPVLPMGVQQGSPACI